jgi:hypothetical protein
MPMNGCSVPINGYHDTDAEGRSSVSRDQFNGPPEPFIRSGDRFNVSHDTFFVSLDTFFATPYRFNATCSPYH